MTPAPAAPIPTVQAVLNVLADRPDVTSAEVAVAAGTGRSTASKVLAALATQGRVLRRPGGYQGGRRAPDRWTLIITTTDTTKNPAVASTARLATTPTTQAADPDRSRPPAPGRLGAGLLRELVEACLVQRPSQALSATAIAKTLDRSAGAVANALQALGRPGTGRPGPHQPPPLRHHPAHRPRCRHDGLTGFPARCRRDTAGTRPPSPQDRVDELVATVAHELRRPLTALLGALATVQQRGPALPAAQHQELLAMARRQGIQLQRLLEQLLIAATLDHSQSAVARPSLIDAAAMATEAAVAAQLAHPDHQISIEAAGTLLVWADPLAITRILGNLLDNAATHAPPGSLIRLTCLRDGAQVVLAVQDQGPGIPPDAYERIFERYTRVAGHAGPAAGGLGLGLYIARRLAHANGGDLQLSHPPGGRGASFELRLPLAHQHQT